MALRHENGGVGAAVYLTVAGVKAGLGRAPIAKPFPGFQRVFGCERGGEPASPFGGLPIAVCFGSPTLAHSPLAQAHPVVAKTAPAFRPAQTHSARGRGGERRRAHRMDWVRASAGRC